MSFKSRFAAFCQTNAQHDFADAEKEAAFRHCQKFRELQKGEVVSLLGRVRSVSLSSKSDVPLFSFSLSDELTSVEVVFVGRRRLGGIEVGRKIKVKGRVCEKDGRFMIFNPVYELFA